MNPPLNVFLTTLQPQKKIILAFSVLMLIVLALMSSMLATGQGAAEATQQTESSGARLTATPESQCSKLSVLWDSPPFDQNNIRMAISNQNPEWVELQSVQVKWNDIEHPWNNMYLGSMSLVDSVHWTGGAAQNIKANGQTTVSTGQLTQGNRTVPGYTDSFWTGIFHNGPVHMQDYMTLLDFGMQFRFRFMSGLMCDYFLLLPGEATPTPTFTATPTQTCEASISLQFGGFSSNNGGVWFNITNYSVQDRKLTGFDLVWPDATHPDITGEPAGGYGLARVFVGGSSLGAGTLVWQAEPPVQPGNTSPSEPYNNRTNSDEKGTWLTDGVLPTGMTIRVYLDFDDVTGNLINYGAQNWHFDRSRFKVSSCDSNETGTAVPTYTPTATSTLVDLPTNEGSITPTPEPTASTVLSEILPNTSFEVDVDGDKVPDGWVAKDKYPETRDKLKCEPGNKNAHSGNCAYKFKPNLDGDPSKLLFKTSDVRLSEVVDYEFSAFIRSNQVTPDMVVGKAKIHFTDGTAETIRLYPEEPYTSPEPLASLGQFDRAGRTVKKITVQFQFPSVYGKLWLDVVSLKLSIDESAPLQPLP